MFVKQISVFLENRIGRLHNLTETLAKNDVDLFSVTLADTQDFGVVRCVTKDSAKALEVLKRAGFTVGVTDLVGVDVGDRPGALNEVLKYLEEGNFAVEYLYSFSRKAGQSANILIKLDQPAAAAEYLKKHGVKLIEELM